MIKVEKRLDNQALGLIPLLLFMFLDNHFSYLLSFIIGISFCFVTIFTYQLLRKDKIYQWMLLPVALTLILYSFFICLPWEALLFIHSEELIEIVFVTILIGTEFCRVKILQHIRLSKEPISKRSELKISLTEYFYVLRFTKNIFTLHLFIILLIKIMPEYLQNPDFANFVTRQAGIWLGLGIILFEGIRLDMMKDRLNKETWLPVLSDEGKVIGRIAKSVSGAFPKKYYHPIVRIAVVYKGMLYLEQRTKTTYVSPEATDYPLYSYVLFRHSITTTVERLTKTLINNNDNNKITPRFQFRYTFENDNVKHLVNLYVLKLESDEELNNIKSETGKLWTVNQIKENLGKGLFSEYFEQEYDYLEQTVLFAENPALWETND